jgi:hypothetical protein
MKRTLVVFGLLAFAGITGLGRFAAAGEECPPVGEWSFLCGPVAAEDLVRVPGTRWIIGSGMSEKAARGDSISSTRTRRPGKSSIPVQARRMSSMPRPMPRVLERPTPRLSVRMALPSMTRATGGQPFSLSITDARPLKCSNSIPQAQSQRSDGSAACRWTRTFP